VRAITKPGSLRFSTWEIIVTFNELMEARTEKLTHTKLPHNESLRRTHVAQSFQSFSSALHSQFPLIWTFTLCDQRHADYKNEIEFKSIVNQM
jgi:hypothetical protein